MIRYVFKKDINQLDSRSIFVNRICKLLYEKYGGDSYAAIKLEKSYFKDFEEHIRNIYQFIDTEIPLYAFYELNQNGSNGLDMTDDEYAVALYNTAIACIEYYGSNGIIKSTTHP